MAGSPAPPTGWFASRMLAPVEVLHLPDPAGLATERFGADRTAELLAEGAAVPLSEIAAQILAMPSPNS